TGEAVTRHLRARGDDVVVLEDRPRADDAYAARARAIETLGARLVETPALAEVDELVRGAALLVPSPGVPDQHVALIRARAHAVPVRSEVDLAAELAAGGPPLVAITGTNGKTTVTTLVEAMLQAAGVRAIAAGNIGRPLLDAVGDD